MRFAISVTEFLIVFPLAWLVEHQLQDKSHLMDLPCIKRGILRIVLIEKSVFRTVFSVI